MTHSFWTFRKRIAIVFEKVSFKKTISDSFLYDGFKKAIVFERKKLSLMNMLTIINERLSWTIVDQGFFEEKKLHANVVNDKFPCPSGRFPLSSSLC